MDHRQASRHIQIITLFAATVAVSLLALQASASAQSIGAEIDLAVPVGDANDGLDLGWGVGARAGMGLPLPVISLDVEAAFDYTSFGITDISERLNIWRILGGLRLGLGIPFVPDLFGHIGYGSVDSTVAGSDSNGGLAWDIGLSSDLVSLAILNLGIHLAYKSVNPGEENGIDPNATTWIGIGIHGEFGF